MYQELYFNSAIFSSNVKFGGTRSRRWLELNEPLRLTAFQVKSVELPLTWNNLPESGTVSNVLTYSNGDNYTDTWTIPSGHYSDVSLTTTMNIGFRGMVPALGNVLPAPNFALFEFLVTDTGIPVFRIPAVSHNAARAGQTFSLTVRISPPLKRFFSIPYDAVSPAGDPQSYEVVSTINPVALDADVNFPGELKLLPNYVYLHSSLMAETDHGTNTRALGAYTSRTIMAQIPLDNSYEWGSQIMPWVNPIIGDKDFMYRASPHQEISRIEFWFTDEAGFLLNFANIQFSLTLSCFT